MKQDSRSDPQQNRLVFFLRINLIQLHFANQ